MQIALTNKTPKVVTRLSVTIEQLQEIIKTLLIAKGNALPGQEIDLEIAPGYVLTFDPQIPIFSEQADRSRTPIIIMGSKAEEELERDPFERITEGRQVIQ